MPTSIVIHKTEIHKINRLLCLNDLHAASPLKGNAKKRPSMWLVNKHTKALISAAEAKSGNRNTGFENDLFADDFKVIRTVVGGKHAGTYAIEDLAIAYAMWLSAEFHLHVIHVFRGAIQSRANAKALRGMQAWQDSRESGKAQHGIKIEHLHELLMHIEEHHPDSSFLDDNPNHTIYTQYARMVKSVVGVKWNSRDDLSTDFLDIVKAIEKRCGSVIETEMKAGTDYHDIYDSCLEVSVTVFEALDGANTEPLAVQQASIFLGTVH